MRQWVKDTHRTIRKPEAHEMQMDGCPYRASDLSKQWIADDLLVPSDRRTYARQTRVLHGYEDHLKAVPAPLAVAE
ncbi:MAG: hypothetical protein U1E06_16095 [Tabrizicola sp.]|nr:hypothetical protein [Tabrizicola sp.]